MSLRDGCVLTFGDDIVPGNFDSGAVNEIRGVMLQYPEKWLYEGTMVRGPHAWQFTADGKLTWRDGRVFEFGEQTEPGKFEAREEFDGIMRGNGLEYEGKMKFVGNGWKCCAHGELRMIANGVVYKFGPNTQPGKFEKGEEFSGVITYPKKHEFKYEKYEGVMKHQNANGRLG